MLIKIYPENPNQRDIDRVVDILNKDGVIIYPTDSVYSMACSLKSKKAFERICLLNDKKDRNNFSLICANLSHLSDYAKVDNVCFKMLKRNLPGAFTFILPASSQVPDKVLDKRKTIGLRIPNNSICQAIIKTLDAPLLSCSIKLSEDELSYINDPELIYDLFAKKIDLCIDGGYGGLVPSTVVDCTSQPYQIVRQGKGILL